MSLGFYGEATGGDQGEAYRPEYAQKLHSLATLYFNINRFQLLLRRKPATIIVARLLPASSQTRRIVEGWFAERTVQKLKATGARRGLNIPFEVAASNRRSFVY